jgi:hypothetical protein
MRRSDASINAALAARGASFHLRAAAQGKGKRNDRS